MTDLPIIPEARLAHGNNYGPRGTALIDLIILHTTESSMESALNWFADPNARVSSHYVIGQDGEVFQCVAEGDCAWHSGNFQYNLRSIGIECEGHAAAADTWTAPLVASLIDLVVDICRRHPTITLDRAHVIGHAEVPDPRDPRRRGGAGGHVDPGPHCPFETVIAEAQRRLTPPAAKEIA